MPGTLAREFTDEELAFFEAMARLASNPLFKELMEAVEAERERYLANLANGIGLRGGATAPPVDQREIDYKRGFWNGAIYAVSKFPKQRAKDWEKFLVENKESETA